MASYNELRKKVNSAGGDFTAAAAAAAKNTSASSAPASDAASEQRKAASVKQNVFDGKKDTETAFILYVEMAKLVSPLDVDLLKYNAKLVDEMATDDDRYVPIESIMFIANNIGYILAMMALNYHDIKESLADALNAEIMTDSMTPEAKLEFRKQTMDDALINSRNLVKMGLTVLDGSAFARIFEMARDNMNYISSIERVMTAIDKANAARSVEDTAIYSTILSNYIYMLRVFSKNAVLLERISDAIDAFKAEYNIR